MAETALAEKVNLTVSIINGKQFVSGLRWWPLRGYRTYKKEAKQIAKKEKWEMVTIRRTRTNIMAGFAPRGKQGIKGMFSMAAALAGQLGDNWVGAFKVSEGRYALAAVHQGSITPGYDLVGTFDEIDLALREVYSLLASSVQGDSNIQLRLIAPQEFAFGNETLELSDLLISRNVKREHRLRPLSIGLTPGELIVVGGAVLVLGGGAYGSKAYIDAKEHDRMVEEAKAVVAAQQAQAAQAEASKTTTVHPWATTPSAETMLQMCGEHLDATPLSIGGWIFTNAKCVPGSASASYTKTEGVPVDEFMRAVQQKTGGQPDINQGTTGTVNYGRAMPPGGDDTLRPIVKVMVDLSSQLQRRGVQLEVKDMVPDAAAAAVSPDTPAPDWQTNQFSIQTTMPPRDLFAGIDTAGIRVLQISTSLESTKAELTWSITGEIYGRR